MADISRSSSDIVYPEWQPEHLAALLELDSEKLRERVAAAETAIFNRLQAISQGSNHTAERQAIEDALQASTFSRGTILDFLTGKRSKESRGNVVTVRGSIFFPMDVFCDRKKTLNSRRSSPVISSK